MVHPLLKGCIATLCASAAFSAAALPQLSLDFRDPYAVVDPMENIEVWVTLTNEGSTDFAFDGNVYPFGLDPDDLPPGFAVFLGASTITGIDCDLNGFTNGCADNGSYEFSFYVGGQPDVPTLNFLNELSLAPGESQDYLLGSFTPGAEGAALGLYSFSSASFGVRFEGISFEGAFIEGSIDLARTCDPETVSCTFSRQVGPIPEPETYGLTLAGLMVVGALGVSRRRSGKSLKA